MILIIRTFKASLFCSSVLGQMLLNDCRDCCWSKSVPTLAGTICTSDTGEANIVDSTAMFFQNSILSNDGTQTHATRSVSQGRLRQL